MAVCVAASLPDAARAQGTLVQTAGAAPLAGRSLEQARGDAVQAARWNAAKDVLSRYLAGAVEDEALMAGLRQQLLGRIGAYVLGEYVTSEQSAGALYQVRLSISLNERKLVADANRILAARAGGSAKARVLLAVADGARGRFVAALAEAFTSRGLFEVADRAVLSRLVEEALGRKLTNGTLTTADIETMQAGQALVREVDFLVAGAATVTRTPRGTWVLSVVDLRVVDLGSGGVLATVTDSVEAMGPTEDAGLANAAIKASAVLAPRLVSQVTARWHELRQVTLVVEHTSWLSPEGRRFYQRVLADCRRCRGHIQRHTGPTAGSSAATFAFRGDIYAVADLVAERLRSAGLSHLTIVNADAARSLLVVGPKR